MKSLVKYIIENLNPDIVAWLKEVYNTMLGLIKNNKLEPIEIDINKLSKPQEPFEYDDFMNNVIVKKIISNNQFGFTIINQMIKMPKKYLVIKNDNKTIDQKPKIFPYWYRPNTEENNKADEESKRETTNNIEATYFIGIIMYDMENILIENYANIVSIETSLCVKESLPVLKAMLNDWSLHSLNKEGKFEGLSSKPIHPKMKAILTKLGFKKSTDNKEILIYKL